MIRDINKFKKEFMRIYKKFDNANTADRVKLSSMKRKYANRFNDLKMSDQTRLLLIENPAKFMGYTNGVGSEVGWFNSFMRWIIPSWMRNFLFGVDITPASDLHDVEYSVKIKFKTIADGEVFKNTGDSSFKENMQTLIKRDKNLDSIDSLRFVKARLYFIAVGYFGSNSFWKGKIKPKV